LTATRVAYNTKMSSDEAVEALSELRKQEPEDARREAARILCDLLCSMGCDDVVAEFEMVTGWCE
jgi:hypothetical protein